MRISILGTGDLTKIPRLVGISKGALDNLMSETARIIADAGHEIVIIPDRGIPVEFAKMYREFGGKRIYGFVPTKDKQFGTRHIQENIKLIDEQVKRNSWYDVDGEIAASGDLCIIFGMSPGIVREFSVLKYHYRYLNCKTKVLWFENTITKKLPEEVMEEFKGKVFYIKSPNDIKKFI